MTPQLYDIFEAHLPFGKVSYPRPAVIVGIGPNEFAVVAISSAFELYKGWPTHFRLEPSDPDFKATGLNRESFASSHPIRNIAIDKLIRKRGHLEGDLLARFKKWI